MIEKIDGSLFDWVTWRNGSLYDLGVTKYREKAILKCSDEIRKYAVGFCPAENIVCRPKHCEIAVMFQKDGLLFWSHLRMNEFLALFGKTLKEAV